MNLLFRKLITITVFFGGLSVNTLLAQEMLEGYLVDKANNQPIPFANIGVKAHATLGTVSNEDGFFDWTLKVLRMTTHCSLRT